MGPAVALVPARAGSQRVPGKNVRPLGRHPLIAYTLAAAAESGRFDAIVVSTDSREIAEVARHYGGEVLSLRPAELATATSPDIDWVRHTLEELREAGREFELFSILRPTSPFRGAATIGRAMDRLAEVDGADSLRAVELCRQHPGKMWVIEDDLMRPLMPQPEGVPHHSQQYAALPEVYVQNSSLEVAFARVATEGGSIAGERVVPFLTEGFEGFSVDYPEDFDAAERALEQGLATLPQVPHTPIEDGVRA